MHRVQIKLMYVVILPIHFGILAYMRCCSLLLASTYPRGRLKLELLWNSFVLFVRIVSQTVPFGFIPIILNQVFRSERSYGIAMSLAVRHVLNVYYAKLWNSNVYMQKTCLAAARDQKGSR